VKQIVRENIRNKKKECAHFIGEVQQQEGSM